MKNSEASEFFFSTSLFSTSSLTFEKKQTLSFVLQAPARSAKGKPLLSMPAVAFSTMQGSLSTRSTVPLGRRGALLSLSPPAPRRRHRRVVAIKDDNQRRVLIPPSHAASTSYSQQQQHMGEEDITEAEKAAEAVAKAVRKKSLFSFFFAFRLASRVVRCVVVNAQKKNFEKLNNSTTTTTVPRRPLRLARALVPRRPRVRPPEGQAHGRQAARLQAGSASRKAKGERQQLPL